MGAATASPGAPGKGLHWDSAAPEMLHLEQGTGWLWQVRRSLHKDEGEHWRCEPGVRSGVWRMEEGFCAGQEPGGVAGGAEQCAAEVLPCRECVWSLSHLWGHSGTEQSHVGRSVQDGRHALSRVGSPCFHALVCSCPSPRPHRPGPSAGAQQLSTQPDFPRRPFPLC